MRLLAIDVRTVPISRYADATIAPGGLTTSAVTITTDVVRDGERVIGLGFSSIGRYGQSGLIRERFAPRLMRAAPERWLSEAGDNIDPFRAWTLMMEGEKPGGHGERCVAVGTLDMALWDAAAKISGQPLWLHMAHRLGRTPAGQVPVYASGGYAHPQDDRRRLVDEVKRFLDLGHTQVKIKIGSDSLATDLARIEAVLPLLSGTQQLAVDAMNRYDAETGPPASQALSPYGLAWFEDICDPLDFELQAALARSYAPAIAAGEALFSAAEARNLIAYGGLRRDLDVLVFDPVHCYGVTEYLRIVELFERAGWPRSAHRPHGGHLFCLHLAAALGLGGVESNPLSFAPFGGIEDIACLRNGKVEPPPVLGIGFEGRPELRELFASVPGG